MTTESSAYPHHQQWRSKANCRGMETEIFFPEDYVEETQLALAACANCIVRQACLEFALLSGEKEGVWGGMTPQERHRYQRSLKRLPGSAA